MFENTSVAVMYAVTPCHAGSGSALGVVDLPIQRERHTNWPMIQASGVKGAFKANFERFQKNISDRSQIEEFNSLSASIFGTDKNGSESGYAGSCSISDARILAFPMRSNVSPFVWITCPAVLQRLKKDLEIAGRDTSKFVNLENISLDEKSAVSFGKTPITGTIVIEDFEVKCVTESENAFAGVKEYFTEADRLILVSNEIFNYGVSNCTQIMAQIAIDSNTGTTSEGSLRYQEELPSDSIMYTIIHWGDSKNSKEKNLKADTIKGFVINEVIKKHIQIAGDETCGRGIFQINWK